MNCIKRLKHNFYSLGYHCTPKLSIHQKSTQKLTWNFLVTLAKAEDKAILEEKIRLEARTKAKAETKEKNKIRS